MRRVLGLAYHLVGHSLHGAAQVSEIVVSQPRTIAKDLDGRVISASNQHRLGKIGLRMSKVTVH